MSNVLANVTVDWKLACPCALIASAPVDEVITTFWLCIPDKTSMRQGGCDNVARPGAYPHTLGEKIMWQAWRWLVLTCLLPKEIRQTYTSSDMLWLSLSPHSLSMP